MLAFAEAITTQNMPLYYRIFYKAFLGKTLVQDNVDKRISASTRNVGDHEKTRNRKERGFLPSVYSVYAVGFFFMKKKTPATNTAMTTTARMMYRMVLSLPEDESPVTVMSCVVLLPS